MNGRLTHQKLNIVAPIYVLLLFFNLFGKEEDESNLNPINLYIIL